MKMVSMKNVNDSSMCAPCAPSEYPYGLRICLNHETLEKLGIKELPAMDSEMMLTAKVMVCSVAEEKMGDDIRRRMELQITDLAIGSPKKSAAEEIYS